MSVRAQLRRPWAWLLAALVAGLVGLRLAGSAPAVVTLGAALAVGTASLLVSGMVGAARTRGRDPAPPRGDLLPEAPAGSPQAELLARSRAAVVRMADLAQRPADPWIAGEVQQVLAGSIPVTESLAQVSGRITLLDSSVVAARPYALAREIAEVQERMRRTTDPQVRREQERALAALDDQAESVDRLLRRRDTLVAQMLAATVGLEGLAARSGELVALGPAGEDTTQATRIVEDLTQSLLADPDLPTGLRRILAEGAAEVERALACRQASAVAG